MKDSLSVVLERCKGQMPDVLVGEHYGYYRHDDVDRLRAFVDAVKATDITHDDLTRMRTEIVYGRIPSKADRLEINAMLGVLRDILDGARA